MQGAEDEAAGNFSKKLFRKKSWKNLVNSNIRLNFALANVKQGSLAQLNRASDYGSEGYRFESCASHFLFLFWLASSTE